MSEAPTTRWSAVLAGRRPGDPGYEQAWTWLAHAYRPVIDAHFRRHAPDATTAQDWADAFVAAWVEGSLDGADPARGPFRAYLGAALRNFRLKALRPRPWLGRATDPDALVGVPAAAEPDPFDRDYARHVLGRALDSLRRYQAAARSQDNRYHDIITALHLEPAAKRPSLRELGERFGLTEKAVERQLEKARGKLREWILAELRETVAAEDEVQAELALLQRFAGEALAGLT